MNRLKLALLYLGVFVLGFGLGAVAVWMLVRNLLWNTPLLTP